MMLPGAEKPELPELPPVRERISFLYLERCVINRADSAITVTDEHGIVHVPAAALSVLVLGPGTTITHRAIELLGDAGATVIWVGEHGVRYYASGQPLTHSSRLLMAQARAVTNTRARLAVARAMYQMRFPSEDVSHYTMQQLRGREGARIRAVYRQASAETGVTWDGRDYLPEDFAGSDAVNMALSAANACLYGIAHSVIIALGCSPGLGFVHNGHDKSFVYDVADLYKTEISIPIAFRIAAQKPDDIGAATRLAVRDAVTDGQLMDRMASDIRNLLLGGVGAETDEETTDDNLDLWDEKVGAVSSGVSYGKDEDEDRRDEE